MFAPSERIYKQFYRSFAPDTGKVNIPPESFRRSESELEPKSPLDYLKGDFPLIIGTKAFYKEWGRIKKREGRAYPLTPENFIWSVGIATPRVEIKPDEPWHYSDTVEIIYPEKEMKVKKRVQETIFNKFAEDETKLAAIRVVEFDEKYQSVSSGRRYKLEITSLIVAHIDQRNREIFELHVVLPAGTEKEDIFNLFDQSVITQVEGEAILFAPSLEDSPQFKYAISIYNSLVGAAEKGDHKIDFEQAKDGLAAIIARDKKGNIRPGKVKYKFIDGHLCTEDWNGKMTPVFMMFDDLEGGKDWLENVDSKIESGGKGDYLYEGGTISAATSNNDEDVNLNDRLKNYIRVNEDGEAEMTMTEPPNWNPKNFPLPKNPYYPNFFLLPPSLFNPIFPLFPKNLSYPAYRLPNQNGPFLFPLFAPFNSKDNPAKKDNPSQPNLEPNIPPESNLDKNSDFPSNKQKDNGFLDEEPRRKEPEIRGKIKGTPFNDEQELTAVDYLIPLVTTINSRRTPKLNILVAASTAFIVREPILSSGGGGGELRNDAMNKLTESTNVGIIHELPLREKQHKKAMQAEGAKTQNKHDGTETRYSVSLQDTNAVTQSAIEGVEYVQAQKVDMKVVETHCNMSLQERQIKVTEKTKNTAAEKTASESSSRDIPWYVSTKPEAATVTRNINQPKSTRIFKETVLFRAQIGATVEIPVAQIGTIVNLLKQMGIPIHEINQYVETSESGKLFLFPEMVAELKEDLGYMGQYVQDNPQIYALGLIFLVFLNLLSGKIILV